MQLKLFDFDVKYLMMYCLWLYLKADAVAISFHILIFLKIWLILFFHFKHCSYMREICRLAVWSVTFDSAFFFHKGNG